MQATIGLTSGGTRADQMMQWETVYYVVLDPQKRILSKYFEPHRAERFTEHFNLLDGAANAHVVRVDFIRKTAYQPRVQSP
jgi:hypothetical protein